MEVSYTQHAKRQNFNDNTRYQLERANGNLLKLNTTQICVAEISLQNGKTAWNKPCRDENIRNKEVFIMWVFYGKIKQNKTCLFGLNILLLLRCFTAYFSSRARTRNTRGTYVQLRAEKLC